MFRFFVNQKRRTAQGGFTLIELVVVLAIIGILLALAVPRYLGARKRAYKAEIDNLLQEAKTLSWAYYQEHDTFDPISDASDIGLTPPGGMHWARPVTTNVVDSISWTASGSVAPLTTLDLCSVILRGDGSAAQGCTF